jgi:hypothetical protein
MPRRYPKRTQLKYTKQRYHVRNWPEYEAGLRKRGDLTLWFSEEAIAVWRASTGEKPAGQPVYSDLAIEAGLTVRLVNGLALRQTEGFLQPISSRRDAQTKCGANASSQHNATVRAIDAGGRRQWEHESGYAGRSLVETTMSRYKAIIGRSMRSRTMLSQNVEATLACAILNRMTYLRMPDGYCIA